MRIFLLMAALVCVLGLAAACSPEEDEGTSEDTDARVVPILVDKDDLYGFAPDTVLGDMWFSDSVGLVGTPIRVVVEFKPNEFDRFKDDVIAGLITLDNASSTKLEEFAVEFDVDARLVEFEFIVPQVKTVPTVLDFVADFRAENPEDSTETFEASLLFQFLVNAGTPAT
ncbi:hypothetical protein K8I61_10450 [bacterium]|nr:hypothetical protein [bacterium]